MKRKVAKAALLTTLLAGLIWVATILPGRKKTSQAERDKMWKRFHSSP